MSEQTVEPTPEAPEAAPEGEPEPFDPERAAAKIKKANDEARNLRARLRELEPLAQEAEKLREAQKTEAQRLVERAEAAERRAQEVELRALRLEVAHDKGLTVAQAKRLVGTTREELEADADELLETFQAKTPAAPRPDLSQGSASNAHMPLNGDPLEQSLKQALGIR